MFVSEIQPPRLPRPALPQTRPPLQRKLYDVERVIIVGKLATTEQHLWYLLDGDVREGSAALLLESGAAYQQRLSLLHLLGYGSQTLHGHKLRGGVDVIALV